MINEKSCPALTSAPDFTMPCVVHRHEDYGIKREKGRERKGKNSTE
jgi:hypothetical protein